MLEFDALFIAPDLPGKQLYQFGCLMSRQAAGGMTQVSQSVFEDHAGDVDPDARVIVTSGYSLVDAPEDLLDRGAVDYVLKPFRVAQLLERIGRALRAGRR